MENKFKRQMDEAKQLIMDWLFAEYGNTQPYDEIFADMERIPIAYLEPDEDGDIQVYVDLQNFAIVRYVDGEYYDEFGYSSLDTFIKSELQRLDFVSLTALE